MQIGEKSRHLVLVEAAGEGRHEIFAGQHYVLYLRIGCGRAAGEFGAIEEAAQIGWNLLEREVVIAVTVSAAGFIESLPLQLLPGEGSGAAAGK